MKSARSALLWFLLALFALIGLTGCESDNASNSANTQIPWSRPTSWEGGVPGMMGSSSSQGR